ncbi:hypothetical protein HMPREF1210_01182 [Paenisporosarcina sp. HGH0030]|uniref:helix-turn-helix transcriptional regulator n=1 Tax=Paenisporosarcina sp. HGH0030 TaxID=1078085 RepID=UPI00034E4FC2|nr:helix-turn-helix domain-containing protein [Paenisporosarcina sp. HGH0030]EPD52802.1 hypothetical protein HMPREF1210_01182 [Paenisporosarcina sp. HGH0030]
MKQWELIRLRKEGGLTQKKMAEILDIDISTYVYKENGKKQFNANEMFMISELLDKKIEDIFLPSNSILNRVCECKSI